MFASPPRFCILLIVAAAVCAGAVSAEKLPMKWRKGERNPILSLGAQGDFDSFNMFAPNVVWDGDHFKMYYSGGPSGPPKGAYVKYQLGLATSRDGVEWRKHPKGPLLPLGKRDNFHCTMAILRRADGRLLVENGTYRMWFTGNRANDLEYATSPDGVSWTKWKGNPVLQGVYAPTVIKDGDVYKLWFTFGGYLDFRIGYATSTDGIHWRKHEGAVLEGEKPGWENGSIVYPFVVKIGESYHLWYTGGAGTGETYIGEATSPDGIHWTKRPDNPILSPSPASTWDSVYTSCACVVPMPDGAWRLYYAGRKDAVHKYFAIGFAEKAAKEHVEDVTARQHAYEVTMGGTLDEFSTAQYLDTYGGFKRLASTFQPNEYLVLENVGDTVAVNPRIVVNGRRDWHSADSILASILKPGMADAQKAMAVWSFTSSIEVQCHDNNRRVDGPSPGDEGGHPSRTSFGERANPVKAANCYYCSGCSLAAANFVILCRRAGLIARAVWMCPLGKYATHCVAEAWHDGAWHLYDPERRAFYLRADNTTVASYEDLHRTPSLEARTHNGGFASKGLKSHADDYKRFFPPKVMPVDDAWVSTMDMTLRPGEKFVWRWGHIGKYRCGDNPRNIRPNRADGLLPYQLANGKLVYRPRLARPGLEQGALSAHNVEPLGAAGLRPRVAGSPAALIYRIASPYPIVGGLVGGKFARKTDADACRILVSACNGGWTKVWSQKGTGGAEARVAIDKVLNPKPTAAIYAYYVKVELLAKARPADAALRALYFETDVQMAATALPALSVGLNRVVYTDESPRGRKVRLAHGWRESSATRPPLPPPRPVAPADGATADPAALTRLAWEPATDPDGQPIADYHVQVSPRADMLHPVSPSFDRITSSGKPDWSVPKGWLVKGRTCHWRVRAKDAWGAWSPWSAVWTFTVGAP